MSPVTVESSQPAPQQPAPPTQGAQPQSAASNQSVRIAALVVLGLVIVVVVAYLIWGRNDTSKPRNKGLVQAIGPIGFSAGNLAQESQFINTKFYWAGKRQGALYEFTRTNTGRLYVRYLPPGIKVGAKGANYLIVATYPFVGAFHALKKQAAGRQIPGPNGSIIYVRPKDPKSVLMGFPGVDDQIEIYAPHAVEALAAARSGEIRPVRDQGSSSTSTSGK